MRIFAEVPPGRASNYNNGVVEYSNFHLFTGYLIVNETGYLGYIYRIYNPLMAFQ